MHLNMGKVSSSYSAGVRVHCHIKFTVCEHFTPSHEAMHLTEYSPFNCPDRIYQRNHSSLLFSFLPRGLPYNEDFSFMYDLWSTATIPSWLHVNSVLFCLCSDIVVSLARFSYLDTMVGRLCMGEAEGRLRNVPLERVSDNDRKVLWFFVKAP